MIKLCQNWSKYETKHYGLRSNMFCEISSSHGGEYDVQSCLLGYTAVYHFTRQYNPEDSSELKCVFFGIRKNGHIVLYIFKKRALKLL
jgi:hypothetical protein